MNVLFRIMLVIYSFVSAILFGFLIIITYRNDLLEDVYSFLAGNAFSDNTVKLTVIFSSLFLFLLSILFFFYAFKKDKNKMVVKKQTDIGEIMISLSSIENIALSEAKKIPGLKNTKAVVIKKDNKVSITIRAIVLPEVNIPEISGMIQQEVKNAVEGTSGIPVKDVKISIESILQSDAVHTQQSYAGNNNPNSLE